MIAAVLAALGAATCFAAAAILQQEAAERTPHSESLHLALLARLLHQPRWLAGVGLLVSGYGFQALALSFGPVALVQPVVATELAIAIPLAIWRRRRRPLLRDWAGITAVVAGVATFLTVAAPVAGITDPPATTWLISLASVALVAAGAIAFARRRAASTRAMALGAAAGMLFALLAVLTKSATHALSANVTAAFSSWQVYLVVAIGIAALVVSQSAYQAAPLAYSMPFIAVIEPVSAVLIGDTVLEENVRLGGAYLAAEAIAGLVATVGIVLLATSPTVLSIYAESTTKTDVETPTTT